MLRLEVADEVWNAVFCPRGRFLLGTTREGLRLWELPSGSERLRCDLNLLRTCPPSQLQFAPEGDLLLLEQHVLDMTPVWEHLEGRGEKHAPARITALRFDPGTNLGFSRNGRHLVALGGRGLEVWDIPQRLCLRRKAAWGDCLAASPDGRFLALGHRHADDVRLLDAATGEERARLQHTNSIQLLTFSPDGSLMASMTRHPSKVHVWETTNWQRLFHGRAFRGVGSSIEFSADNRFLAASGDQEVRLWDIQTCREAANLDWKIGVLRRVTLAPDGMTAAAVGTHDIMVWDMDDL